MTPIRTTLCLLLVIPLFTALGQLNECSTVVSEGNGTVDGRPLLWKNRDTDQLNNKVVLVRERPYSYLALVDDDDSSGRTAWVGLNENGVCHL